MEASSSPGPIPRGDTPTLFVSGWEVDEHVTHDRVFVIGRSPTADFQLDADSRQFSRRCVELRFESHSWLMSNVSGSNFVQYTSGPLLATLGPGTTVTLDRPSYTLYFRVGDTVRVDLRLENLNAAIDLDKPTAQFAVDPTNIFPELTDRQRIVAAAILEPLLRDPTLGMTCIRSDKAAAAQIGSTAKAVEHVVTSLRGSFSAYAESSAQHRIDRYQLFDFLRRSGRVTAADLVRIDRLAT